MTQAATQDTEAQTLPTIIDPLDPTIDQKGGYGNAIIDIGKALKLRIDKDMTYAQIAAVLSKETGQSLTKQAVWARLRPFTKLIDDPTAVRAYENNKETLLSAVEQRLLVEMVDPDKLKSASLNNVAYSFKELFNANRLQRDKSTSNVSVKSVVEDIRRRREELEKSRENCG
ncbi:MAG: hypothetical protein V3U75_01230 [Methylococcaceae bacterium]